MAIEVPLKKSSPQDAASTLDDEIKLKQLALLDLQLEETKASAFKRQREQQEEETAKERKLAQHKSMAKESLSTESQLLQKQLRCDHRKDDGQPHTAATHDYDENIIMICQECHKQWKSNEPNFPQHLVNRKNHIGGPGAH